MPVDHDDLPNAKVWQLRAAAGARHAWAPHLQPPPLLPDAPWRAGAQDPDLNDKVLIFAPDGKCMDYFITEPPALLAANKRTDATAFVLGPKDQLYFPLNAFAAGNNFNEFTGGWAAFWRCAVKLESLLASWRKGAQQHGVSRAQHTNPLRIRRLCSAQTCRSELHHSWSTRCPGTVRTTSRRSPTTRRHTRLSWRSTTRCSARMSRRCWPRHSTAPSRAPTRARWRMSARALTSSSMMGQRADRARQRSFPFQMNTRTRGNARITGVSADVAACTTPGEKSGGGQAITQPTQASFDAWSIRG